MGPHQAQIIINLKPMSGFKKTGPGYRMVSTSDVLQKIKGQIGAKELSGASIEYILQESVFQSAFQAGAPVVIEIKGRELSVLRRITADVEAGLRTIPGIYSIRDTRVAPAPEVKVNVFKDKAATYSLSTSDIALTAQTAIKGYIATKFKKEGEEVDIRVQIKKLDRDNMAKVRQLQINSPLGLDVPLSELAYLSIGRGPSEIKRQDQERVIAVSASIFQKSFKEVADKVIGMLSKINIPSAYSAKLTGEREQIQESFRSLQMALFLSVLLVYMIMASQFESLWQPFVILFTVPLSIIGVIIILLLTNTPLSIMVILGVIILGGVVVNNGIVLIDYTNILRSKGMNACDAVITSSRRRLRPIIMTALTTILGLVPLALALNKGAQLQQPMAIAVIGGLAVSTFLSLIVIPVIYLSFDDMISFIKKKRHKPGDDEGYLPASPDIGPDITPGLMGHRTKASEGPAGPAPVSGPPVLQENMEGPDDSKTAGDKDKGLPETEGESKKPVKIQYEDDIVDDGTPKKRVIKEDEITPPIILPYKPEDALDPGPLLLPGLPVDMPPVQEGPRSEDDTSIGGKRQTNFSERKKELIGYLKENKKITRKEYSDKFNISIPTAARDLKDLLRSGILVARGPAAVGRYYILSNDV
jgi:hypothetical protein